MYWTPVCTCVRVGCSAEMVHMKGAQQSSILLFIEKHCHYKVKQVWPLTRPSDIFNSSSLLSSSKLYKLSLERISASLNKRNFKFRLNRFFLYWSEHALIFVLKSLWTKNEWMINGGCVFEGADNVDLYWTHPKHWRHINSVTDICSNNQNLLGKPWGRYDGWILIL